MSSSSALRFLSSGLQRFSAVRCFTSSTARQGLYEPEDLPPPGPPAHNLVNIRMRGYDFTILEHYMYYTTKLAHSLGAEITKRWATPATTAHINAFKPRSTLLQNEFDLSIYERNVQLANVSTGLTGILLDVLTSTAPEGVTITLKPHEPLDEEYRFIPDYELNALKAELREMITPDPKKFKKKN